MNGLFWIIMILFLAHAWHDVSAYVREHPELTWRDYLWRV